MMTPLIFPSWSVAYWIMQEVAMHERCPVSSIRHHTILEPAMANETEQEKLRAMNPALAKVHGRKRGHVTPREELYINSALPRHTPPQATSRPELLTLLGADPAHSRLVVEVGFGNGQFLAALAAQYPMDRFIGIEVFLEGVSALVRRVENAQLTNVFVLRGNAQELLGTWFPDQCLDRVIVNFPDPWPKSRHHKRRIVQDFFLDQVSAKLKPQGLLTLATDWEEYAFWMRDHLERRPDFANCAGIGQWAAQPQDWITTRFQDKGMQAGRAIYHLAYQRRS